MKKYIFMFSAIILFALGFIACDKSDELSGENSRMRSPKIEYDEKLAAEYNADFDKVAFAVNRLLEQNQEFRDIIHKEVGEMFDGDYNVLISQLVKNYISVAEWLAELDVDIHSIVEKYPLIQIAVPVEYEKWDKQEGLPVVFMDYGFNEGESLFVQGYDSKGESIKLDAVEEPEFPVVVIGENERTSVLNELPKEPATPQNLTAIDDENGIMLEWEQYSNEYLVGYDIYRKGESDEDFVQIASLVSSKSDKNTYSFVDGNVLGGEYQYYVVGSGNHNTSDFIVIAGDLYTLEKNVGILYSGLSNVVFANESSSNSLYLSIYYHTSNSLKLEWSRNLLGTYTYYILRARYPTPPCNLVNIGSTTSKSFIDTNLDKTCMYRYVIEEGTRSNFVISHVSDRSNNQKVQIKECKFDTKADLRKVECWTRGAPEMRVYCYVSRKDGFRKNTLLKFEPNKSADIYDRWYTVNRTFLKENEVNTYGSIVSFFWYEEDNVSPDGNHVDGKPSYEDKSSFSNVNIVETLSSKRIADTYTGDDFITPASKINGYYYNANTLQNFQWWDNESKTYSESGNVKFKWKVRTIN